ncbi:hypothetical protein cyc_05591 [Cyclospora cayetanensis]|uniref:Chromo domain-containing protein n=1 Tax=Cyclospora cayetanensis TaxID=88456 RepID=A0A1D3CR53_9EIME|nr:hypothetical protein cyc_05591 [Cyclospora cayetanensis]
MATFVEGEDSRYPVEDITAVKRVFGKFYFRVKWKDYDSSSDDTWEPIESFQRSTNFEFKDRIESLKRWGGNKSQKAQTKAPRLRPREHGVPLPALVNGRSDGGRRAAPKGPQEPLKPLEDLPEDRNEDMLHKAVEIGYRGWESRCSKQAGSPVSSAGNPSSLLSSPFSSAGSSSESDSSYCEEGDRKRRQKQELQNKHQGRSRVVGGLRRSSKKQRQGFPPPETAPIEPYLPRLVEQRDLLRLQERQKQTGGKLGWHQAVSEPCPRSVSLSPSSSEADRRKQRRRQRDLQKKQQQQQVEAKDSGAVKLERRRGPPRRCRRGLSMGYGRSHPIEICSFSERSRGRSVERSVGAAAAPTKGANSSPLQSWLEREEEAPDLRPAELGNRGNAYLEFRGHWDPVARAKHRCRELRQLQQQLQQRRHTIPRNRVPFLQHRERDALAEQRKKRPLEGLQTAEAVEIVGLVVGAGDAGEVEVRHQCTEGCYCRSGYE